MKKRILALLLMAAMLISMCAILSACDGDTVTDENGEVTGETTGDGEQPEGEITFKLWDVNQKPGMDLMVADYIDNVNPNAKINVEVLEWGLYWQAMEEDREAGQMPDVVWMHSNYFAEYAEAGALLDVTDVVDASKFNAGMIDTFTVGDQLLGVPKDNSAIAVIYNKTLFEAAGADLPTDSWTWDDFSAAAKAITDKGGDAVDVDGNKLDDKGEVVMIDDPEGALDDDGNVVQVPDQETVSIKTYGFAADAGEDESGWLNTIYQAGGFTVKNDGDGTVTGYADPATIKGVEFYLGFQKDGQSPTQKDFTQVGRNARFNNGTIGMMFVGNWTIGEFKDAIGDSFEWDFAVMPAGDGGCKTISNGLIYSGYSGTQNPELTKDFLQYLASEAAQKIQSESGTAISAYEGTGAAFSETFADLNVAAFTNMMADGNAVWYPTSPSKPEWVSLERGDGIEKMSGDIDNVNIADEMAIIDEAIKKVIADNE